MATPALDLSARVCATSERGLLGVAVDPTFADNGFIYLYYTFNRSGACVNRVSRFTLSGGNTASGETVLIDNIPSPAGNHNGGDLHFGKDGYLYVSVGDGGSTAALARDQSSLLGKILRITGDGGVPGSNPFAGAAGARRCGDPAGVPPGTGPCREIFAPGLRNPFRFAFDPNASGTRFYINDVGAGTWEEIDSGRAGADTVGPCAKGPARSARRLIAARRRPG